MAPREHPFLSCLEHIMGSLHKRHTIPAHELQVLWWQGVEKVSIRFSDHGLSIDDRATACAVDCFICVHNRNDFKRATLRLLHDTKDTEFIPFVNHSDTYPYMGDFLRHCDKMNMSLVTDIYRVTAMGLCNRCSVTVPNAQPRNAVPERSERLPKPGTGSLGRE
jgi:hypothetical protein